MGCIMKFIEVAPLSSHLLIKLFDAFNIIKSLIFSFLYLSIFLKKKIKKRKVQPKNTGNIQEKHLRRRRKENKEIMKAKHKES
jgi:hypothetical protein